MLIVNFARIRPDKEVRLRTWLAELSARRDEVRASLSQEHTRQEQMYILPGADGPVLVVVMEAEDARRAYAAYATSHLPIDVAHRAVLAEALLEPLELEPLHDCTAT